MGKSDKKLYGGKNPPKYTEVSLQIGTINCSEYIFCLNSHILFEIQMVQLWHNLKKFNKYGIQKQIVSNMQYKFVYSAGNILPGNNILPD